MAGAKRFSGDIQEKIAKVDPEKKRKILLGGLLTVLLVALIVLAPDLAQTVQNADMYNRATPRIESSSSRKPTVSVEDQKSDAAMNRAKKFMRSSEWDKARQAVEEALLAKPGNDVAATLLTKIEEFEIGR